MEDAFVQGVSKILLAVSAVIGGSFLTLLKHWGLRGQVLPSASIYLMGCFRWKGCWDLVF